MPSVSDRLGWSTVQRHHPGRGGPSTVDHPSRSDLLGMLFDTKAERRRDTPMADGRRWKSTLVVEFYKEGSFYEAEDYLIERISPIKDILVWKSMPREPDPAEEQEWEERRKHRYQ